MHVVEPEQELIEVPVLTTVSQLELLEAAGLVELTREAGVDRAGGQQRAVGGEVDA